VWRREKPLWLASERGRLSKPPPRLGAMAAIFADESTVAASLGDAENIAVAAVNAPYNTVISGERGAVTAAAEHFSSRGIGAQLLNVSHAFHSPLMQPIMGELGRTAAAIAAQSPQIPWISTTSGAAFTQPPDARYLCNHALN